MFRGYASTVKETTITPTFLFLFLDIQTTGLLSLKLVVKLKFMSYFSKFFWEIFLGQSINRRLYYILIYANGGKIVKKIQTIVTTITIIAVMLITFPAATAAPKIVSTFEQHLLLIPATGSPGSIISEGSMTYVTNAISTGNAVTTSAPILSGTYTIKLSGFFDATSGTGAFYGKWLITTSGDGFSGLVIGESKGTSDPSEFEIKGTFIGFGEGIYRGDRIKGSFSGSANYESLTVDIVVAGTFYDKR